MIALVAGGAAAGGAVGWFAAPHAWRFLPEQARARRAGRLAPRLAVASATAAVWALLAWRIGLVPELPAFLYLGTVGTLLAAVDLAVRRLPDLLVLPSYPIGTGLLMVATLVAAEFWPLVGALAGAVALWAAYAVQRLFAARSIGRGDVKLAGVLGLYLGWLGSGAWLLGLVAGFFFGGLFGIALIALRKATRKTEIPFGPFMLLGALFAIAMS
ncbi:prepilin peptidase [Actinomadura luteofluorescens]|uniref:prepilin peptidase n=1 Tax=Actinomadura luteofluorescens TaxID=46163 RepID=UPI003D8E4BA4